MNETGSKRPAAVEHVIQIVRDLQRRRGLFPLLTSTATPPAESIRQVVIVGVSGGKDSICLLHLLSDLAVPWGLELHVAHCNHNLRPTAGRDSQFVEQVAHAWDLPFHETSLDPAALEKSPEGLEAAARRARYQFLIAIADAVTPASQEPIVAVAHQRDDQAETVLMNLIRGAGLHGLGGMDYVTCHQTSPSGRTVRIIRPLLDVSSSQIIEYLTAINQTWQEDETNQDQSRFRNRVRHQLIPLMREFNPQIEAGIIRTADILRGEALRIDALDRDNFQAVSFSSSKHRAPSTANACTTQDNIPASNADTVRQVFNLPAFLDLSLAAQRGVVRHALGRLQVDLREVGMADIDAMIRQLRHDTPTGGPYSLSGQFCWSVAAATASHPSRFSIHHNSTLPFEPDHPYLTSGSYQMETGVESKRRPQITSFEVTSDARAAAIQVPLPCPCVMHIPNGWTLTCMRMPVTQLPEGWSQKQPWHVYLDAVQINEPVLTGPIQGLRFAPFGLRGRHKQLGDYFTDHKVPRSLRSGWPILLDSVSQEILWVCGYEIAYHARVTDRTTEVLNFIWAMQPQATC